MATKINMPRLSDTMTEGTVATWLKKVGDKIQEGDILAEIETDKATMEFESFNAGTLLYIGIREGETAPVDSLLAIIGDAGENITDLVKDGGQGKKKETTKQDAAVVEEKKPEQKEEDSKEVDSSDKENKSEDTSPSDKTGTSEEKSINGLPEGVVIVTMPRLSDTMSEGTVAKWLKKVGDKINEGDILAEIETDKATMEFESFNAGTLLKIGIDEGQTAPVDALLAIIGPAGTDVSNIDAKARGNISEKESSKEAQSGKTDTTKQDDSKIAPEDSDDNNIEENHDGKRIFVSPLAKKMASEKGLELAKIKGSGENGRIVKQDVEDYKSPQAQPSTPSEIKAEQPAQQVHSFQKFVPAGQESSEEIKNSQMRKTIARRLGESAFTAPHYFLTIEVKMDESIKSRNTINALPDTKISFNDFVIKACALALKRHPKVNSQWKDDVTVINHHVHIGVAVAVVEGLLVPVLRFADQMSLTQIGAAVKDLASKAKSKKIQPSEMEGSTFTVSNLGMFGITEFTSIINQPNSAILSVGAIIEKPVVRNGQIVVGNTMKVTLACDHRTVDGATGAQFLQTLSGYLESPVTMLA